MVSGTWDINISILDVNKLVFLINTAFWLTKYFQTFHNFVYHETLCHRWQFQTYQEKAWAKCDELVALSHGLIHHIPNKLNCNRILIEFEILYENLVIHISHILDDNLTRLRSTCERYSKIHVPYKYKTIIDSLWKSQNICIIKQDKGRGVVVIE